MDVLFQEKVFPLKIAQSHLVLTLKWSLADPMFPHWTPSSVSDSPQRAPSSPLSSNDITSPANDSLVSHSSPHIDASNSSSSHTTSPSPPVHTDCDTHISPTHVRTEPHIRKSTRSKFLPVWLKDFICSKPSSTVPLSPTNPLPTHSNSQSHSITSLTPYPLFLSSHLAHFSSSYVASLVSVLNTPDPRHYSQAQQYPEWEMAMQQELTALE